LIDVAYEAGADQVYLPPCTPMTEPAATPLTAPQEREELVSVEARAYAGPALWLHDGLGRHLTVCGEAAYVLGPEGRIDRVTPAEVRTLPGRGAGVEIRDVSCMADGALAVVADLRQTVERSHPEGIELTVWHGSAAVRRTRWRTPRSVWVEALDQWDGGPLTMLVVGHGATGATLADVGSSGVLGNARQMPAERFGGRDSASIRDLAISGDTAAVLVSELQGQSGPFQYGVQLVSRDGGVTTQPAWEGHAWPVGRFVAGTPSVDVDGWSAAVVGPRGVAWLEQGRVVDRVAPPPKSLFAGAVVVGDELWLAGTLKKGDSDPHTDGFVGAVRSGGSLRTRPIVGMPSASTTGVGVLDGRPLVAVNVPSAAQGAGASARAGEVLLDAPGTWIWFPNAPL